MKVESLTSKILLYKAKSTNHKGSTNPVVRLVGGVSPRGLRPAVPSARFFTAMAQW